MATLMWLAAAAASASCGEACHCDPHRNKPWRRVADPPVEPSAELRAARGAEGEAARADVLARRAHTVRIQLTTEPRHLNPLIAPSVAALRVTRGTVFETLVRYQPPAGGGAAGRGYQPGLARSWTTSPDGMQIRIELRDDVRFHDGRRMHSGDAQFSLDAARDARFDAPHLRARLADISKVDRAGPHGLLIWLHRPSGWVLRALAEVPILPEHVYLHNLRPGRGPVVGSGPYRLASWASGVIHLQAHAGYWGARPAVADLEFVHEPDPARALIAAKRGELDIIPELHPAHHPEQTWAPGIGCPRDRPAERRCFDPLRLRPPVFRYLVFAADRPPFDDVRVRRAVSLLVDRRAIAHRADINDDLARPIAGPVWPGGPGDGPSPAPPVHDPAEAYQLLDAAGWRDSDGDRRRERHRQPLRIELLVVEGEDPERASIIASLVGAGFAVDDRPAKPAYILNRLRAADFHLALVEWRGSVDDDLAPLLETGGDLNFGRFSSPAVDAALQELRLSSDPSARATRMAALSAAIADTYPLAGVVAPDPYGLVHRRVRGVVVSSGWIALTELALVDAPHP